jgi:hypothetical protein
VALELEYIVEALEEAEAAARWYAERSATAAPHPFNRSTASRAIQPLTRRAKYAPPGRHSKRALAIHPREVTRGGVERLKVVERLKAPCR